MGMTTRKALNGKPHVRFDEGEVALTATPRCGSLLCKTSAMMMLGAAGELQACG